MKNYLKACFLSIFLVASAFANNWPTDHSNNAVYTQLKRGYGSFEQIIDSYVWWGSDGYLWIEIIPLTDMPFVCGGGELTQNGITNSYYLIRKEGGYMTFCDNLSEKQVFKISAGSDGPLWGFQTIIFDDLYDEKIIIPAPTGPAPKKHFQISINVEGGGKLTGNAIYFKPMPLMPEASSVKCNSSCASMIRRDSTIELTAENIYTDDYIIAFKEWTGHCEGQISNKCTLVMDEDKNIGVKFIRKNPITGEVEPDEPPNIVSGKQKTLTVEKIGKGLVRESTNRIFCGSRCSSSFKRKSRVLLTVQPAENWYFVRWRGACALKKSCVVKMNTSKKVKAIFASYNFGDDDGDLCTIGRIRICSK